MFLEHFLIFGFSFSLISSFGLFFSFILNHDLFRGVGTKFLDHEVVGGLPK